MSEKISDLVCWIAIVIVATPFMAEYALRCWASFMEAYWRARVRIKNAPEAVNKTDL